MKRELVGYDLFGNVEISEIVQLLDIARIITRKTRFKSLNRLISPSPKTSIDKEPKLELKAQPYYFKFSLFCKDVTLLVSLFVSLSDMPVKEALTVLNRRKKAIDGKYQIS